MAILEDMDEIIIEEKKYISSKQAANITGYAKDYIGQLCREGRVPARLVGRSWYVLESAIQDHRFGNPEIETKNVTPKVEEQPVQQPRAWESLHYEVSKIGLPAEEQQSQEIETQAPVSDEGKQDIAIAKEAPKSFNDAWSEWFDQAQKVAPAIKTATPQISIVAKSENLEEDQEAILTQPDDEDVNVPLKVIHYQQIPSREPLVAVARVAEERVVSGEQRYQEEDGDRAAIRLIRVSSIVIATIFVVLAAIGSGYLDGYLTSYNPVSILSGSITYER